MSDLTYWEECISIAAEECGLSMTGEQCQELAESVSVGHENYGMAFYSPPASDRIFDIEREWKRKYDALKAEFEAYRGDAETAVKRALKCHYDANVTIGSHGEVLRHDGSTERIQ
jgi:hypothetical protein